MRTWDSQKLTKSENIKSPFQIYTLKDFFSKLNKSSNQLFNLQFPHRSYISLSRFTILVLSKKFFLHFWKEGCFLNASFTLCSPLEVTLLQRIKLKQIFCKQARLSTASQRLHKPLSVTAWQLPKSNLRLRKCPSPFKLVARASNPMFVILEQLWKFNVTLCKERSLVKLLLMWKSPALVICQHHVNSRFIFWRKLHVFKLLDKLWSSTSVSQQPKYKVISFTNLGLFKHLWV